MRNLLLMALLMVELYSQKLTILTESFNPYNYEHEGKIKGISTAIVRAIQQKVGNADPIDRYPWKRAYAMVQENPNTVVFSMARTKARESLFQWVGPLAESAIYFFENSENSTGIQTLEDAKKVELIGIKSSKNASYERLSSLGFKNLITGSETSTTYSLLIHKRVSLIPSDPLTTPIILSKEGYPQSTFKNTGVLIYKDDLYIAFSKTTDPAIVTKWQQALEELKKSGAFEKLQASALKEAYTNFGIKE